MSSNSLKKTKKKNHKNLNVIFDIDETLIQTHHITSDYKDYYSKGDMIEGETSRGKFHIYKRPYLNELLNYAFKYYQVSFWTLGIREYCKEVLNKILTPEQLKKTKIILAREEENEFYEFKSRKHYIMNLHSDQITKPLDYLWEHPDFKNRFNRKNTFLVDDSVLHTAINQYNSLFIYPWCRFDLKDEKLKELIEILKKNKNAKKVKKIKSYTLRVPRTLQITEVSAEQCREIKEEKDIKYILEKFS